MVNCKLVVKLRSSAEMLMRFLCESDVQVFSVRSETCSVVYCKRSELKINEDINLTEN